MFKKIIGSRKFIPKYNTHPLGLELVQKRTQHKNSNKIEIYDPLVSSTDKIWGMTFDYNQNYVQWYKFSDDYIVVIKNYTDLVIHKFESGKMIRHIHYNGSHIHNVWICRETIVVYLSYRNTSYISIRKINDVNDEGVRIIVDKVIIGDVVANPYDENIIIISFVYDYVSHKFAVVNTTTHTGKYIKNEDMFGDKVLCTKFYSSDKICIITKQHVETMDVIFKKRTINFSFTDCDMHDCYTFCCDISDDGKMLVIVQQGGFIIFDFENGNKLFSTSFEPFPLNKYNWGNGSWKASFVDGNRRIVCDSSFNGCGSNLSTIVNNLIGEVDNPLSTPVQIFIDISKGNDSKKAIIPFILFMKKQNLSYMSMQLIGYFTKCHLDQLDWGLNGY